MGLFDIFRKRHSIASSSLLQGAEDRHCHVLFGVDDGITTLEDSLKVLEYDETVGVSDVWCTPHIMEDVPNTTEGLRQRFAEIQQAYTGPIRLHLAVEYMLDNLFEERLKSGDLLTMGDDTILVETSTWNPPTNFRWTLKEIMKAGFHPLLAHPERYRYLEMKDYAELIKMGVKFQLNLPALAGMYSPHTEQKAYRLLEKGYYDVAGTDIHSFRSFSQVTERKTIQSKRLKHLQPKEL
jgi:tyrosine-protein phosphatase YwqE